jgi:3-isopropylmalate dehydratase small subunit
LKKTSSKNEFNLAKQMEGKNIPILESFAKIYKTDIINGKMLIILEELEEDPHIEDLYYELQNYLDEQGLPIQYIDNLDTDDIEISEELQNFMSDLDDIIRAYRYLGVEASDITPENMGYSKEGKLKAFDIDDKQR